MKDVNYQFLAWHKRSQLLLQTLLPITSQKLSTVLAWTWHDHMDTCCSDCQESKLNCSWSRTPGSVFFSGSCMLGHQVEIVCVAVDGGRITTSLLEYGAVSNIVDLHLLLLITFSNNLFSVCSASL